MSIKSIPKLDLTLKKKYEYDPEMQKVQEEVKTLIMYTGGTFGMKQSEIGYKPEPNYLLGKLLKSDDFYDEEFTSKQTKAPEGEPDWYWTPETRLGKSLRSRI